MSEKTEKPDYAFYAKELKSGQCQCGKSKKSGKSLCWSCYRALPDDFQKDLYLGLYNGYVAAYEAAVIFLND
jgi:hypothetical protein